MKGGRSRLYAVGIATMVAGILGVGAAALTVLFTGNPAFPVTVFGKVEGLADRVARGEVIRRPGETPVRQGHLADPTLLRFAHGIAAWMGGNEVPDARGQLLGQARLWSSAKQWDRSLEAYDRLLEDAPNDTRLRLERARVLGWSGQPLAAARALVDLLGDRPEDAALQVEAAQYFWWGGESAAADSLLAEAVQGGRAGEAAVRLQSEIRRTMRPDVRVAQRWVRQGGGARERLALARAYVDEKQYADALPHFRTLLAAGDAPDSLYLELASAAAAADSVEVMVGALQQYLRLHPTDRGVQLTLARAHGWRQEYAPAIQLYEALLAERDDPELRFEVGQLRAWSGQTADAARDLRRVAVERPDYAPAFKLLGDLALWEGDWALAVERYQHAVSLDPTMEGLGTGLSEARRQLALARLAAAPLELGQCLVRVDSYTDNQGFRWASARASRVWRSGWGTVEIAARQELSSSDALPGGDGSLAGFGATAELRAPVGRGVTLSALAGLSEYSSTAVLATWGAGVLLTDVAGAQISARYSHEPALRRAGTVAALRAQTSADVLQMTAYRSLGEADVFAQVEAERFTSGLGSTERYGASASVSRALSSRLTAAASISALASSGPSPALPTGGALYWTPELYVAPSVTLRYTLPLGERWRMAGSVSPGYAWVREGSGALRRFGADQMATLGLGLDVAYRYGPWVVQGNAGWSGPLGTEGYRATTLQLQGSYQLDRP